MSAAGSPVLATGGSGDLLVGRRRDATGANGRSVHERVVRAHGCMGPPPKWRAGAVCEALALDEVLVALGDVWSAPVRSAALSGSGHARRGWRSVVTKNRGPRDGVVAGAARPDPTGVSHVSLGPGAEFDLVRTLVDRWGPTARGLGNDCAVLDVPAGERLVVSTDTAVEDVHFRASWLTPHEIGFRAAMSAWSDLAAAAATPIGAVLALTVPRHWVAEVAAIADGIGEAARIVEAPIVGGDTVAGPALVITMTVLGSAARPLARDRARPGDHVYVTGTLGGPFAAIRAWERGDTPAAAARLRFTRPQARLREARWLAARGATAAIDVSDGLIGDLRHIAAASGVRLVIELDRVPTWVGLTAAEAGASGEEYELACTAPTAIDPDAFVREFRLPLTRIGRVAAGPPGVDVFVGGQRVDPMPSYDHFSS